MTMHAIEDMPHMFSPASGQPLYAAWQLKAAYAAGMERAAEICQGVADTPDYYGPSEAGFCADTIRTEIKGE